MARQQMETVAHPAGKQPAGKYTVSLTYGAVFVVASYMIVFGLDQLGVASLIFPMMAGFMLIGPLAAVGLYEISRLNAAGGRATWHAYKAMVE